MVFGNGTWDLDIIAEYSQYDRFLLLLLLLHFLLVNHILTLSLRDLERVSWGYCITLHSTQLYVSSAGT